MLSSLIFNIFLSDLLLIMDDIDLASYADDNTHYAAESSINK